MEGYRRIAGIVRDLAREHAGGKLLIVQEGGYHVTYSAYCLHATLEGAVGLGEAPLLTDPIAYYPEDDGLTVEVVNSIERHWKKMMIPLFRDV